MDSAIRQALLKNDSIASQLDLIFAGTGKPRTIRIKLEIDVNPPTGSGEDATYLDFPADYEVRHQDLPSNRSEEHTSELQSLMRISYAVFCLKTKKYLKPIVIIKDDIIMTNT